jgi:hypothetical protein
VQFGQRSFGVNHYCHQTTSTGGDYSTFAFGVTINSLFRM